MRELAIFPLQTVLFPGGRLPLQIFEARYLDLMGRCLRDGSDFGIVRLVGGHEVRRPGDGDPRVAAVGTTARIEQADMPRAGLMLVRLLGERRFRVGTIVARQNGLWTTQATELPEDPCVAPAPEHAPVVDALRTVLARLITTGSPPESPPASPPNDAMRFDDAAWVAHRWCELVPAEPAVKQGWLELDDPRARLDGVAQWLADQGFVAAG